MPGRFSPAAAQRARDLDRALDANAAGRSQNRDAAAKVPPSHGDPPRSRNVPNTGNGRVAR
jgi:hypothetical protein